MFFVNFVTSIDVLILIHLSFPISPRPNASITLGMLFWWSQIPRLHQSPHLSAEMGQEVHPFFLTFGLHVVRNAGDGNSLPILIAFCKNSAAVSTSLSAVIPS
jgi:hypothetical protein